MSISDLEVLCLFLNIKKCLEKILVLTLVKKNKFFSKIIYFSQESNLDQQGENLLS